MTKYLLLSLCGILLSACTQAGPYVTNISRSKSGELMVEKCMMVHNAFLAVVHNENCTSQSI